MKYKTLFSPIEIGGMRVKNRIVMAPMGANFENVDGSVSESLLDYFEARSRGGVGLIISPFTMVNEEQRTATLGVYSDRFVPGLNRLCERVQAHGARFLLQIAHPGAKVMGSLTGRQPVAPSAFKSPIFWQKPRALTTQEIEQLIEEFALAAVRAQVAGFDGVEVHGAHTYLIGQFISPHSNHRQDAYGGDFERRMAFPSAIVERIKKLCGYEYVVGFKFSAHEELEGGVDAPLAKRIAAYMEERGVHYIHVATTSSIPGLLEVSSEFPSDPSIYSPPGVLLPLAEEVKRSVTIPVIGTGGISDPELADQILREEKVDLVATGRAQIADAQWSERARRGEPIRFCIKCNLCHKRLYSKKRLKCSVNPIVGEEQRFDMRPALKRKKIVVVGGGPAGMEAALTASQRGHEVVLFEASNRLGGKMIPGSAPLFKAEIGKLLEYYERSLQASDVELRLEAAVGPVDGSAGKHGTAVDVKSLLDEQGLDLVIWATGAELVLPEVPISRLKGIRTVLELYEGKPEKLTDDIVIIGAGFVGCETAWHLASLGKSVRIVDAISEKEMLANEHPTNRTTLLRILELEGVSILNDRPVVAIDEEGVTVRRADGEEEHLSAAEIVIATGFRPIAALERLSAGLSDHARFRAIGDCTFPGNLNDAIHAGFNAGWEA